MPLWSPLSLPPRPAAPAPLLHIKLSIKAASAAASLFQFSQARRAPIRACVIPHRHKKETKLCFLNCSWNSLAALHRHADNQRVCCNIQFGLHGALVGHEKDYDEAETLSKRASAEPAHTA
ncbi:hypothetical protein L7F22_046729 [Adiantum nelumboides]|nr:hypothetical protein [Adiantum nelumboides]